MVFLGTSVFQEVVFEGRGLRTKRFRVKVPSEREVVSNEVEE